MRVARLIVRILLGFVFTVFGLNGFLHFLPMPPMSGPPAEFFGALASTHYLLPVIFGAQAVGGILLLVGIAVPFALILLAPVIVGILGFHFGFQILAPSAVGPAIVVTVCELFLAFANGDKFSALFSS